MEKPVSKKAGNGKLWVVIFCELAFIFTLIFASTFSNWPHYIFLRTLVLLPVFHAGITLGISGGIMTAMISSLVYAIVIPADIRAMEKFFAMSFSAGMIVMFNVFAVFIGGTIGKSKQTLKELTSLSEVFIKIAAETDEKDIMLTMARETMSVLEARLTAFSMRPGAKTGSLDEWTAYCLCETDAEPELISGLDETHPGWRETGCEDCHAFPL